jgi:hypothetical protein
MPKLVTETELKERIYEIYQEEFTKILNEKWNKLTNQDKRIVVEMLKTIYPDKKHLLKEDKWYNTVGDILGIFDPTGIVDLVNGISYWRQGDKLYAILSWISVLPFLGDAIAKPVIGVLKVGGSATKAFRAAVIAKDATKIGSMAKNAGGPIAKMVEKTPSWGPKLIELLRKSVGRVPGVGKGLVNAVEEYVQIFTKAGKEVTLPSKVMKGGKMVNVQKALTAAEKETLLKQLAKQEGKVFSGYKDMKNSWWKYMSSDATLGQKLYAGVPRIFGGNPATRSLMRRTKVYLGFLDWLGLANFVGPDELQQTIPNAEEKWNEYSQTPEAQQMWSSEMGVGQTQTQTQTQPSTTPNEKGGDVLSTIIGGLLGSPTKLL